MSKSESNIKAIRRHVFDEMYEYYESNQHAHSPGAESGLAPPSNDEMWFGDLDFSALATGRFYLGLVLVITLIILLLSNKLLSLRLYQDTR